jgi:Ca2+-transporting ATPase
MGTVAIATQHGLHRIPQGLTSTEAATRLRADGPNELPTAERRGVTALALGVVLEPMFLLLVAAIAIYVVLGDLREALVLGASVAGVIAITVVQENKAERALEALRELSSPRALVIRDGERRWIAGREVVLGDLLLLSEGDRMSADARLVEAEDLAADESLLTGESLPADRLVGDTVFSGTLVVRGRARAEVNATGPRSELGRIGASLGALRIERTSLEAETARVVRWIAAFAVVLCIVVASAQFALHGDLLSGLLTGLTLAMALLPEEFPVVLTVFLALGAWRISRKGVLTRRMPSIEMLGAATVLCVDKTGTLTENRMTVVDTPAPVLDTAALACEIDASDPMERAIVDAADPATIAMRATWSLEHDYPFSASFLAVCHVWRSPAGERRIAVKGAPETVLRLCGAMDRMHVVDAFSRKGRRILAVAEASWDGDLPEHPTAFPFRLVGFLQLADPLRRSVPAAIEEFRRAGIRVAMITGDFPGTALHIAAQAGIETDAVLTGDEIAVLDDRALAEAVRRVRVFARVRPEQKLRLVHAYRAAGEVVAMTGDGVNDAPALKAAHIGIAMGQRGTDVAREAASLVLLEDEFGSIVHTVRLGRRIYENIRHAMSYLISVHMPIAGMSILPVLLGGPIVLFPVHVVFLEFIIDPASTLVFEAESGGSDLMGRPPRDPKKRLFDARLLGTGLALGAVLLASALAAYGWALRSGLPEAEVRAVTFTAMVVGNLALLCSARSGGKTVARSFGDRNPALWWIVGGSLSTLAAVLFVPAIASTFQFEAPGLSGIVAAVVCGVLGVLCYDVFKVLRRAA